MESNTANSGTINRQYWRNDITLLEPQKTPYTSRVGKKTEAAAMLVETFGDRLGTVTTAGKREGGPSGVGGNALKDIGRFGAFQHFTQQEWAVTHHQRIIAQRGGLAGISDAEEYSRTRTELLVKLNIEVVNCSNLETQDGQGGVADMQTRGAFRWLDDNGALTPTVDPKFRATLASHIIHGNVSGMLFTEDQLYQQLKELARIRGESQGFFGLFGLNVVETLDKMSRIASTNVIANPPAAVLYTTRQNDQEHTIQLLVNVYKCSFGSVEVVPTTRLLWNDATQLGDPNAGLTLDPDLWFLDFLENINEATTFGRDTGNATASGGTWQSTWVNECRSPRGNGRILQTDL